MRDIEFRAKTLEGKWIYGNLFKSQSGGYYNIVDTDNDQVDVRFTLVEGKTVGQNIGIWDKNGNRIFENDIVRVKDCETFVVKYQFNEFRFIPICNAYQ